MAYLQSLFVMLPQSSAEHASLPFQVFQPEQRPDSSKTAWRNGQGALLTVTFEAAPHCSAGILFL